MSLVLQKTPSDRVFDGFLYGFMIAFGLVTLFPIYYVFIISITPITEVISKGGFVLFPTSVTFEAYHHIFSSARVPSTLAVHSSQMYSKNLQNLLALMIDKEGQFHLDMSDDIIAKTVITMNGNVIHEGTNQRLNPAPAPA